MLTNIFFAFFGIDIDTNDTTLLLIYQHCTLVIRSMSYYLIWKTENYKWLMQNINDGALTKIG